MLPRHSPPAVSGLGTLLGSSSPLGSVKQACTALVGSVGCEPPEGRRPARPLARHPLGVLLATLLLRLRNPLSAPGLRPPARIFCIGLIGFGGLRLRGTCPARGEARATAAAEAQLFILSGSEPARDALRPLTSLRSFSSSPLSKASLLALHSLAASVRPGWLRAGIERSQPGGRSPPAGGGSGLLPAFFVLGALPPRRLRVAATEATAGAETLYPVLWAASRASRSG